MELDVMHRVFSNYASLEEVLDKDCVEWREVASQHLKIFAQNLIVSSNDKLPALTRQTGDKLSEPNIHFFRNNYFIARRAVDYIFNKYLYAFVNNSVFSELLKMIGVSNLTMLLDSFLFTKIGTSLYLQRTGIRISNFAWAKSYSLHSHRIEKNSRVLNINFGNDKSRGENANPGSKSKMKKAPKGHEKMSISKSRRQLGKTSFRSLTCYESLPEFREVYIRHKSCNFRSLLDKYCPISRKRLSVEEDVQQVTGHKGVCAFMQAVLFYVFPLKLFGTKANRQSMYRNLKLLVTCGNKIALHTRNFLGNVKVEDIAWLGDSQFQVVVDWLVEYFVRLLRDNFYITTNKQHKTKLLFYRHEVWTSLTDRSFNELKTRGQLMRITDPGADCCSSKVRFIPKSKDLRMINSQICAEGQAWKMRADNRMLCTVIKSLHSNTKMLLADSVASFVAKVKAARDSEPEEQFYFIRADMKDCYPSVCHSKLMEIVETRFRAKFGMADHVLMQEFHVVKTLKDKLFAVPQFHILCDDNVCLDFSNVQWDPKKYSNRIIVPKDQVLVTDVLSKISNYVTKHVITISEKQKVLLAKGVTQGGRLSMDLCSLYMESLSQNYFADVLSNSEDTLLIDADDMLFLTPSLERARGIMDRLAAGFPDYNLTVNVKKLRTNLPSHHFTTRFNLSSEIIFGSHLYNIETGALERNYNPYQGEDIRYSFHCNPFFSLRKMCKTLSQTPLNLNYLDLNENINNQLTVVKNIFQSALIQSMRLCAFVKLSPKWSKEQNRNCVVKFSARLSLSVSRSASYWMRSKGIAFTLSEAELCFITSSAHLLLWSSVMSHRGGEVRDLKKLLRGLRQFVSTRRLRSWDALFSKYPKQPFCDIKFPKKLE